MRTSLLASGTLVRDALPNYCTANAIAIDVNVANVTKPGQATVIRCTVWCAPPL